MQDKTITKILTAYENGELNTDDSIVDFAKANHLSFNEVLTCLANHDDRYEACYGCEHIVDRCYPGVWSASCNSCSRRIVTSDHYKKSSKRYRTKSERKE